jgi:pimeloyl-ACP methyl ester carboxylesterase
VIRIRLSIKDYQSVRAGFLIIGAIVFLVQVWAHAQESAAWRDPSPHRVQFVTIDGNVRLEVLDWGGSGSPLVLLAGLGNTAHVFDEFAPKLAGYCHVFGITRRGYGSSSRPESGYTASRLAEDVLAVLDAIKLSRPVLAGHSFAGEELTVLGMRYSRRIGGLVYMDAAADRTPTAPATTDARIQEFRKKFPVPQGLPKMTESDLASFPAAQAYWRKWGVGVTLQEAEIRQMFQATPEGRVGGHRTPGSIGQACRAGVEKPDFASIRVPVLSFVTLPSVADCLRSLQREDDDAREACVGVTAVSRSLREERIRAFQTSVPQARVVAPPLAKHYVFISNEEDVLREMRAFLTSLR